MKILICSAYAVFLPEIVVIFGFAAFAVAHFTSQINVLDL